MFVATVATINIELTQLRVYTVAMAKETDRVFQMRVSDAFIRTIDDWRREQPDLPARAEAIRRLVEIALEKQRPKRK